MKPETKAEGKPENLQDTEVKQQSKKKNQWIKEEIKRVRKFCQKIKNILRQMKTQHTKTYGVLQNSAQRGTDSCKCLH